MSSVQAAFEQNFRAKWSVWAALGAGCLLGMSGILLIQRLSNRVEQVSSQSLSREVSSLLKTAKELLDEIHHMKKTSLKPALRSVTFSDVDLSLEEREQAMMVATCSNLSSATSNTEYFSAVSSDDEEDDFFDIQTDTEKEFDDEDDTPTPTPGSSNGTNLSTLSEEVQRLHEEKELLKIFTTWDKLMEGSATEQRKAFEMLKRKEHLLCESSQFLWRLCKCMYLNAVILGQEGDEDGKRDLIFSAVDYGKRAIQFDENSSEAHKWFAIVLGSRGEYLGIKEKILDGFEFKKHIDIASNLAPQDHTIRHLQGRFCFEVSELSWWERKMAATLFADPPTATIEEARDHFLAAEELKPDGWKENRQYLAKCYINMKDYQTALEWLDKANELPINNPDDQQAQNDIEDMLKQYEGYR